MSEGISRRRMLQLTGVGVLGAGAALAIAGCSSEESSASSGSSGSSSSSSSSSGSYELKVYDPSGATEITHLFAPRLDSIDGKTIAFVADDMWQSDRTFPVIQELIEEKYPNVTIVPADNFPQSMDVLTEEDNGIAEQMQEFDVDAVILGNAG